jgi:hypothetical protein
MVTENPASASPGTERPWWCQDSSCQPDANHLPVDSSLPRDALGGWCTGRVPEPVTYERHGYHHVNDGHFCIRTPARGVVMLEIREGDLEIMARVILRGLVERAPERKFYWPWFTHRSEDHVAIGGKDS